MRCREICSVDIILIIQMHVEPTNAIYCKEEEVWAITPMSDDAQQSQHLLKKVRQTKICNSVTSEIGSSILITSVDDFMGP